MWSLVEGGGQNHGLTWAKHLSHFVLRGSGEYTVGQFWEGRLRRVVQLSGRGVFSWSNLRCFGVQKRKKGVFWLGEGVTPVLP